MKLKITITGPKVHDVGYRVFLLKHAMNTALPGLSIYNWDEDGQQEVIALVEGDEARIKAFLKAIEKTRPELAEVVKITSDSYEGEVGRTSEVAMLCSFVQLDKAIPLLLDMRDDLKAVRKTTDATFEETKAIRKTTDATFEETKAIRKTTDATFEETKAIRKTTDITLEETKAIRKTTDATFEETKAIRKTTDATFEETKAIRKTTDITLEETKAIRKTTDITLEETKAIRKTTDITLEETKAIRKTTDITLEETRAIRKTTDATLEEIKGMREDIQPGYGTSFRQMQADVRVIKERLGML